MRGLWTLMALALIAALAWFGLRHVLPSASESQDEPQDRVEICDAAIAGSNTIGEGMAASVVRSFLQSRGYAVGETEQTAEGEVRFVGAREERMCTIAIRSHGSSRAFTELAAGTTLIGMASRPIKPAEVDALRDAGAGDFAAESNVAEHVIALDGIAIIVHPSNPLTAMAMRDVRRVFLSEARDWSALGAPRAPIALYARDDNSGTFQFFFDHALMESAAWSASAERARRFESSSALVQAVAADPTGIGFVGSAYVTPAVRALSISDGGPAFQPTAQNVRAEDYPISRRLYLYVRPQTYRENRFAEALISYFKSPESYAAIEAQDFISLRPEASAPTPGAAAATPAGSGCVAGAAETEVYRTLTTGGRRLDTVIRFLPGSNAVDSLARDDLQRAEPAIAEALRSGGVVRLIGHSDSEGDAAINRRLARDRADAIRVAFEGLGLYGLQVDSAGEMCPVADNATAAGKRTNRRVEIWIIGRAA